MEYSKYLKSDKWYRKRISATKKALGRCQLCNSKEKINVHHRTYERIFNELLSDLIVLCERCHKHFHNIMPEYKKPVLANIKLKPDKTLKEFDELECQLKITTDDEEVKKILRKISDLSKQRYSTK